MLNRLSHLAIPLAVLGLLAGFAQGAPDSIDRLAKEVKLEEPQVEKITAYADYWTQQLADTSPESVQMARTRLTDPLRTVSGQPASLLFRTTYSKSLIPKLTEIINGPSRYQAINAIQVAASLGTADALTLMERHIEPAEEARPHIRLWAAIGIGRCLDIPTLRSDKINGSLVSLSYGAKQETDPLVLRRELETLDQAVHNKRAKNLGGEAIRDKAIELEIAVVKETMKRLKEGKAPAALLAGLQPGLVLIRNQYIDPQLQRQELKTENNRSEKVATYIGRNVAPQLGQVYDVILVNESAIRSDPELAKAAGQLLDSSESTLKLVDSHLRGGETPAVSSGRDLWTQGNRSGLEESRDKWQVVLTAQPYNN